MHDLQAQKRGENSPQSSNDATTETRSTNKSRSMRQQPRVSKAAIGTGGVGGQKKSREQASKMSLSRLLTDNEKETEEKKGKAKETPKKGNRSKAPGKSAIQDLEFYKTAVSTLKKEKTPMRSQMQGAKEPEKGAWPFGRTDRDACAYQ
ncbi:hypothetical protein WR25_25127 [Diploscapter pachys]|uniref:Uncharacterized protein n=1 Tax=Diploscapter pachys TaxID=2018661 RepID=A0A2A2LVK4_9BILA|nr:hypothetical protein WR25_25127 [Diploscapter pachys]